MKKIYQTIIDPQIGNCMQAAIASLFDEELENVPNFISFGDNWYWEYIEYIKSKGYRLISETLYNEKLSPDVINELSFKTLQNYEGINGLFYASVYSPKYNPTGKLGGTSHAVLIDKDFNIVHDPNPNNIGIKYPHSEYYNGIITIELYEKIQIKA